jgi:hypothetical protein
MIALRRCAEGGQHSGLVDLVLLGGKREGGTGLGNDWRVEEV